MNFLKPITYLLCITTCTTSVANTLKFEIKDVRSDKGVIYIQLFNSEANYDANKALKNAQAMATKGALTVTFNNLVDGEYAVRYFHDENSSGQLESNMFGIPTEGFGYSNNAKPHYGPATYQDMKFTISGVQTINQSTIAY